MRCSSDEVLSGRTLPKRWAAAGAGAEPPAGAGGGGGVRALACDQRGYSPKASPPDASVRPMIVQSDSDKPSPTSDPRTARVLIHATFHTTSIF
jgi:hypothetical protein